MRISISRFISILGVTTLLFVGTTAIGNTDSVSAADDVGEVGGPTMASAPLQNWITLEDGGKHWYAFTEAGDGNDVEVRLATSLSDRAAFEVWTSEQLRQWQNGDEFDAVGAGTVNKNLKDDLYWTGNFVASNTYYVIVNSRNFGAVDYQLSITGDDVGYPAVAAISETPLDTADGEAEMVETSAVEAESVTLQEESLALVVDEPSVDGTSADEISVEDSEKGTHAGIAYAPIGEIRTIGPGETHWYSFRDEGDKGTIAAVLDASPTLGVLFEVWTADQLREWQNGDTFDPVGAGTKNKALDIDHYWTGSFVRSGDYYVIVRHTRLISDSSRYSLLVTGEDVSY